jgi:putative transposase
MNLMPRTARAAAGGYCYHVLNRGNARAEVFHKAEDFEAFLGLIGEATLRIPMRVLAYCLMPNHFHLVVWPRDDGDLSRWMHWLLTAHVRRHLRHYRSSGHVWQGRFKAFPIQEDDHLRAVLRYVERNALRAGLVTRAEDWAWSSLARGDQAPLLEAGPAPRGPGWIEAVNAVMTEAECAAVRESVRRDRPLGEEGWVRRTATALGLESSLRDRGRPRRASDGGGGSPLIRPTSHVRDEA